MTEDLITSRVRVCRSDLHPKADRRERKNLVYVGFTDLEKAYGRVNREALWQALRIYDVGGKLLNDIKTMYVNSLE